MSFLLLVVHKLEELLLKIQKSYNVLTVKTNNDWLSVLAERIHIVSKVIVKAIGMMK